ncbi:MAG: primosomal protein N', partial [Pseudomonadota bacterium]
MITADLLFPIAVHHSFKYAWHEDKEPVIGSMVRAKLLNRTLVGVVWSGRAVQPFDQKGFLHLKPVLGTIDLPPLSLKHIQFIEWLASYYLVSYGQALKLTLNIKRAFEPRFQKIICLDHKGLGQLHKQQTKPLTKRQMQVVDWLKEHLSAEPTTLMREASVSRDILTRLQKKGLLKVIHQIKPDEDIEAPNPDYGIIKFYEEQKQAFNTIEQWFDHHSAQRKPLVVEGVTGSGKTELYFELIAKALKDKEGQILVMLPEIALTLQWVKRFKKRFGSMPDIWHSDLSEHQRAKIWRRVIQSKTRLVIGVRSSLFLPFNNLSLIIIDEEHDGAYKQDDGTIYHARDMAVICAKLHHAALMLVSATPSFETKANILKNRYQHVVLKTRALQASPVKIELINMRLQNLPRGVLISEPLKEGVNQALSSQLQSLLF